jgi:hypothetical protein
MGGNCSLESIADDDHQAKDDMEGCHFDKARADEILKRTGDSAAPAQEEHWSDFSTPPHVLNDSSSPVTTQNPIRARHQSAVSSVDEDMTTTAPQRTNLSGLSYSSKHQGGANPMVAHRRQSKSTAIHHTSRNTKQLLYPFHCCDGTAVPIPPSNVLIPTTTSDATFPSPQLHCRHQKEDLDGVSDTDHLCASLHPSSSSTPSDPAGASSPLRGNVVNGVTSPSPSKRAAEDFGPLSWISDANGRVHVGGDDCDTASIEDAFYLLPGDNATKSLGPPRNRHHSQHHRLSRSISSSSVITLAGRGNGGVCPSHTPSIPMASAALDISSTHFDSGPPVALSSTSYPIAMHSNDHGHSTSSIASTLSDAAFLDSAQWDTLSRVQRMASARAMVQKLKEVRQENELISKGWRRSGRGEGTRSFNGSMQSSDGSTVSVSFKDNRQGGADDDDDA